MHRVQARDRHHLFAALALISFFLFPGSSTHEGLQLFHKMQNALGGAQRIAAVRDFEQVERADTWFPDGKPRGVVRKRVRFIRPTFLRIDQVGPGDTYVLYFDGKSGWEILPDKKVAVLAEGELRFAQRYLNGLGLNSWLLDRDPDVVFTSTRPNVLTITTKDDPAHGNEITLDARTSLPVSGRGISLSDPDHPVASETKTEQWQATGGIMFPRHITNLHEGKKLAEITVVEIKLDHGLKRGDLATKPANLNPVMSPE